MVTMHERLQEVGQLTKRLQSEFPNETNKFLEFLKSAESGSAISVKNKELINTALAVAKQCEWCIAFHVKHAVKAGASRHELIEAGFQAVVMHGGPAFMWMTPLLKAVDEFIPAGD